MKKGCRLKQEPPTVPDALAGSRGVGYLAVNLLSVLALNVLLEAMKRHLAQMIYTHGVTEAVMCRTGVQGFHSSLRHILQPLENFMVNQLVGHSLWYVNIAQNRVLKHSLVFPIQLWPFFHAHNILSLPFKVVVHLHNTQMKVWKNLEVFTKRASCKSGDYAVK